MTKEEAAVVAAAEAFWRLNPIQEPTPGAGYRLNGYSVPIYDAARELLEAVEALRAARVKAIAGEILDAERP